MGYESDLMLNILEYGLKETKPGAIGCCKIMVFLLIFQLRSVPIASIAPAEVSLSEKGLWVEVEVCKGKSLDRPFILYYPVYLIWLPGRGAHELIHRCLGARPDSQGTLDLEEGGSMGSVNLATVETRDLQMVAATAPKGY